MQVTSVMRHVILMASFVAGEQDQICARHVRLVVSHRKYLRSFSTFSGECIYQLQTALSTIADWMASNLLCLNSTKTEFLLLGLPSQLNKIRNPVLTVSSIFHLCPFYVTKQAATNVLPSNYQRLDVNHIFSQEVSELFSGEGSFMKNQVHSHYLLNPSYDKTTFIFL